MKKTKNKGGMFDIDAYDAIYSALPKAQSDQLKKMLVDVLVDNKSIKECMHIGDNQLEALYTLGYSRFKLHKFEEAKSIFQLLSIMNHHEPKYTLAIAACYRMSGDFEHAIVMYQILMQKHPKYIDAYINLSECYFRLEEWDNLVAIFDLIDCYCRMTPLNRFNQKRFQTIRSKFNIRFEQEKSKASFEKNVG